MSQEVELKLTLPRTALPALRRHPLVAAAEKLGKAVTLDNTYYDTPELALKARKVGVRTRRQGRQWLQTVKCAAESAGGLSQRPEWEQPYAGDFDFSAVDMPEVAKLLRKHGEALVPVFTTRFRRETRRYAPAPGVSILMMIDTGAIELGERSTPICELELELEQGTPLDLLTLACELARDVPLAPSDVSKAERGYRLFLGDTPCPVRAGPSPIQPTQSVLEAFRSLAFACLRQWQANAAGAAENHEPEFIHQLRVSQRRLRSLLRFFASALPADVVAAWKGRLGDNADRFGDARDLDVLCEEFLAPVAAAGPAASDLVDGKDLQRLLATAEEARQQAHRQAEQALDTAEQGRLILEFTTTLYSLPAEPESSPDLPGFATRQLALLRKRARRRFDAAADLLPAHLHRLRIALKHLRYAVEFFAPLFPAKAVSRYLKAVVRAQNTLGFLNDLTVARARLAHWTGDDAGLGATAAFVCGWHGARHAHLQRRILHDVEPLLWGKTPWRGKDGIASRGRNR